MLELQGANITRRACMQSEFRRGLQGFDPETDCEDGHANTHGGISRPPGRSRAEAGRVLPRETLARSCRCVSLAAIVSRIIRRRRSIAPSKGRPLPPALCRRAITGLCARRRLCALFSLFFYFSSSFLSAGRFYHVPTAIESCSFTADNIVVAPLRIGDSERTIFP